MAERAEGMQDGVEIALDARAEHGEGPLWDAAQGVLAWVDIAGYAVHLYDPATGADRAIDVGQPVSALAVRAAGGLMVTLQEGFATLDPATGQVEVVAAVDAGQPGMRMNDGKCDSRGRFWGSTMATDKREGAGALYRLEPDRRLSAVLRGMTIPNGPAWSVDGRTMYVTDSAEGTIYAFDFEARSGALSNRRPFINVSPEVGQPDGMTVDAEDHLWVAVWGGWAVHRYTPGGRLERAVRLPVAHVSCPTFGGADLGDLYVTTAAIDLSPEERSRQPHAGSLFRYRPGVRGRPPFAFEG